VGVVRSSAIKTEHGAWQAWHEGAGPIRLGVSTCLLGENVRYDGGHKRDAFLVEELGRWVEWVSVCPEVELGMGVPRPSVRLVEATSGDGRELHMLSPDTGEDFTERMRAFAAARVAELQELELDGYVLKKNSPSCGMARVKVWGFHGPKRRDGVGLFAEALLAAWPHLPIEEEGRLADPVLRENFVERIFCRNRWRAFLRRGPTRARLVEFWTAHKLLVRAHDEPGYQRLGRLVGSAKRGGDAALYASFEAELFGALAKRATTRKHTNVLQHAMGHLREHVDAGERAQLATAIEDYHRGLLPLVVPVTLLRFQVHKHSIPYLQGQLYFDPHPKELMLRNRV
jgi:uncharacterized protein YbbK (DUF523 family)/uncharacterized protein YbgA (DUF1722 family)